MGTYIRRDISEDLSWWIPFGDEGFFEWGFDRWSMKY